MSPIVDKGDYLYFYLVWECGFRPYVGVPLGGAAGSGLLGLATPVDPATLAIRAVLGALDCHGYVSGMSHTTMT